MAVMQQKLYFGGIDSSAYGVYISGEGVFNSPKRAVNMVAVPGRNGAVAVDQGYWENIEVTYPAFISASSLTALTTALSNYRNAIVSQIGYQRLNDTINSSEYRMAVYSEGLEFEPIGDSTTVQFELKFNCKPQRFLTSGESVIIGLSSGSTVTNPTQYDASPLLEVTGTGSINFNGYDIEISSDTYGNIVIVDEFTTNQTKSFTLDSTKYNSGDYLSIPAYTCNYSFFPKAYGSELIQSYTLSDSGGCTSTVTSETAGYRVNFQTLYPALSWDTSTNHSSTYTCTVSITTNQRTTSIIFRIITSYTASTNTLSFTFNITGGGITYMLYQKSLAVGNIMINSTKSIINGTTYIDCDLGEAYSVNNGDITGLNAYIDLGSDLPKLAAGSNTITFDNTITSLLLTPRWWKL